jgi:hypothetical protein
MRGRTVAGVLLLYAATAAAEPTDAERAEARALFEQGVEALRQGAFPDALAAFEASWRLNPRPFVLYNAAMCRQELFDYPGAIAGFEEYLEVGANEEPAERLADARERIAELEQRVGRVALAIEPPGARVLVDGREVGTTPLAEPLRVGPGTHAIEVRLDGYAELRREVSVAQGERVEIVAELTATGSTEVEPPPPPVVPFTETPAVEGEDGGIATKWWFWTVLGVVVAGGAVTAGVLLWPSDEAPADDWVLHGP